ncbi:MAG: S41 family peptidase [Armatimonadota bacterium]
MLCGAFATNIMFALYVVTLLAQPTELTETLKAETLNEFARELDRSYVHRDVAKRIGAEFDKWKLTPDYEQVSSGEEFANRINAIMRGQVTDGHLSIRYSAEKLPPRQERMKPSQEEIAQDQKMMRMTNAGFTKVERLGGNIGYVKINQFFQLADSKRPIQASMKFLSNTDAMIIDLREHRGGHSETADFFTSIFFDPKAPVKFWDVYDRLQDKKFAVWSSKNTMGLRYTKPIYVLISGATGSAGESVAYNLQAYKRSTTIGSKSYGIANMGNFFRINDHFMSLIPFAQGRNPVTGTNWEKVGVVPEIKASITESLVEAQKLALENLMSATQDPSDKAALSGALARLKA